MPNKKKKYSARFPPARIKKIMQKDDEVGKVAAAVPVIISRSLELFIESLIKKANNLVLSKNARTLTPQHIKQTVLHESEFKFLHDLVSSIPDVQSIDEEQTQQPLQEVSVPPRPVTETTAPIAASSTPLNKPAGRQRGRPRKVKPEDQGMKQTKAKKPRLAPNIEECDSEETCSGSEEDSKEPNDQPKPAQKGSATLKASSINRITHYLPNFPCQNIIVSPASIPAIVTDPTNHTSPDILPMTSVILPTSSKISDAFIALNSFNNSSIVKQQNSLTQPPDDEVLDLSTTSGKNGATCSATNFMPVDMKLKMEDGENDAKSQNLLQNNNKDVATVAIPRTFYVTNILDGNVQTVNQSGVAADDDDISMPPVHQNELYKLNIPKLPIQTTGVATPKSDLMLPKNSVNIIKSDISPPVQNIMQTTLHGTQPTMTYQIQNFTQNMDLPTQIHHLPSQSGLTKGKQSNIVHPQAGSAVAQNNASESRFFNIGSPVQQFQYSGFVPLVPGASLSGMKLPNSYQVEANASGNMEVVGNYPNEDSKVASVSNVENCSSKCSTNRS